MGPAFCNSRVVEFADTDMAGIVHFARFFHWMESTEHAFLRSVGLSVVMTWEGQSLGFPRVAASCDYERPVRFEDVVDVTLMVERVGARSVRYAFEFHHRGDRVATGHLTAVCCRMGADDEALRSVDIPAGVRARLVGEHLGEPASL